MGYIKAVERKARRKRGVWRPPLWVLQSSSVCVRSCALFAVEVLVRLLLVVPLRSNIELMQKKVRFLLALCFLPSIFWYGTN